MADGNPLVLLEFWIDDHFGTDTIMIELFADKFPVEVAKLLDLFKGGFYKGSRILPATKDVTAEDESIAKLGVTTPDGFLILMTHTEGAYLSGNVVNVGKVVQGSKVFDRLQESGVYAEVTSCSQYDTVKAAKKQREKEMYEELMDDVNNLYLSHEKRREWFARAMKEPYLREALGLKLPEEGDSNCCACDRDEAKPLRPAWRSTYGPCCKIFKYPDGCDVDGCPEFIAGMDDEMFCGGCTCHRNFHTVTMAEAMYGPCSARRAGGGRCQCTGYTGKNAHSCENCGCGRPFHKLSWVALPAPAPCSLDGCQQLLLVHEKSQEKCGACGCNRDCHA